MKTLFIPAKSTLKISKLNLEKLPKNIALFYSIQYINQAKYIKDQLSKSYKITKFSQTLGCSKPKIPKSTKAILLISDGKFHATSLAQDTKIPVYLFENNQLRKISSNEIKKLKQKQKAAYMNYLNQDKIGILISTKFGQQKLSQALKLKKKIKNKKSYLFLANNINTNEFENFQIKSFINTACPRMDRNDSRIINISQFDVY